MTQEVRFKDTGYSFAGYPEIEPNTFELIIRLVNNTTGKRTSPDPRIAATIAGIFRSFLARNERVIVYIFLTSLTIRHDNPSKVRIVEAFDRLTSGQEGDKP